MPTSLRGDPGRLADEADAIGLFGGNRLIWVRGAGNDRALTAAVSAIAGSLPETTTVIIEAGELKKGTALRRAVEERRGALAVPCYADESRGIHALIDEELGSAGLRITPAARERLSASARRRSPRLARRAAQAGPLLPRRRAGDRGRRSGERRRRLCPVRRRRRRRRAHRRSVRPGRCPAAHHRIEDGASTRCCSPACASSRCSTRCAARWPSRGEALRRSWPGADDTCTSAANRPSRRRSRYGRRRRYCQAMDHLHRAVLEMRRDAGDRERCRAPRPAGGGAALVRRAQR